MTYATWIEGFSGQGIEIICSAEEGAKTRPE
jgi:hypothetical protein